MMWHKILEGHFFPWKICKKNEPALSQDDNNLQLSSAAPIYRVMPQFNTKLVHTFTLSAGAI